MLYDNTIRGIRDALNAHIVAECEKITDLLARQRKLATSAAFSAAKEYFDAGWRVQVLDEWDTYYIVSFGDESSEYDTEGIFSLLCLDSCAESEEVVEYLVALTSDS